MCSISGIIDYQNTDHVKYEWLMRMGTALEHRGPDQQGHYMNSYLGFWHNRLAIVDIENGLQPMKREYQGKKYVIIYNGELYNTQDLTQQLRTEGIEPTTRSDTEIVLWMYIRYGENCAKWLNGIFAFAVWDEDKQQVYLARDRFGIKPLFYSRQGTTFLFASEVKGILECPLVKPVVTYEGLWQLLYMTPTKINGSSVFDGIDEIPVGCCGIYDRSGFRLWHYWNLEAKEFTDTEDEAVEKTRELLTDAIRHQLVSDVPLATLLSGGLDSSVITSVAQRIYQSEGRTLGTYSFEYAGNKENFKATLFQPQSDDDFARYLAEILGTNHHILSIENQVLADLLFDATTARDLPGMADIDSSLLYYCREIKKEHTVVISGECADEIFGGYPWFYRPEMLHNGFFPWIHDPIARAEIFKQEKTKAKEGLDYILGVYQKSVAECPMLDTDSPSMRQSRIASWLSVQYFMTSLLERKDRMSMASGVEVRVPFADHRILEYVYNVPWEIKFKGQVEKSLLREAMKDYLPEKYLKRKKSPYPKTHNPQYEELIYKDLMKRLGRPDSRLKELIDEKAVRAMLETQNVTWFGQLMSKPQLMAWLLQFDYWLETYEVELKL